MQKVILVGAAGFIGTVIRYGVAEFSSRKYVSEFPVTTLIVNLVGCFLAGLAFYWLQSRLPDSGLAQAVILIGFLGGLTTFSSYGLQTFELIHQGHLGFALINITASNAAGLFMVWAGYRCAQLV